MMRSQQVRVGKHELALTNAEKIYFPEDGYTKGQVIGFYSAIAEFILPHLHDRPLTMKRYPEGVTGEHFYEKNAPTHTPDWVERFAVPRSEGGGAIHYVLCNDLATLVWTTNLGDIEKHVLLAKAPYLNRPTAVVFDLDPGEGAGLMECAEVALYLKSMFDAFKLRSFIKVSGSKGLHLTVPLNSDVTYELTQPFAKAVAELTVQQMPDKVVSEMTKALRKGKVLIDWSQNSDFKTTVCVYAMRAKREAPFISLPITWEELKRAVKKGDEKALVFSPEAAIKRLKRVRDLFSPVLKLKQKLPAKFAKALAEGPPPKLSSWPRNRRTSDNPKDKSLREYAAKRDHTQTTEPAANLATSKATGKGPLRYVIQKHAASHLHYDWRLEMQGVLRSWAVPKGPPRKPKEARLAMHVEDHPIEYADFEGTIPPGNYGAGTVMVWDQGEYEELSGNPTAAFYQGKMHLILRGKKLKGEWIMVKDRRESDSNKWLLVKAGKAQVLSAKADDTSVISGRSMKQIARDNDKQWKSNRETAQAKNKPSRSGRGNAAATFVEPMKCKPVAELPEDTGWTFEVKYDGYRCLACKNGDKVELMSRNKNNLNHRFPQIVQALSAVPDDFTIDGEVVALDGEGKPSFQLLQNNRSGKVPTQYYLFDLLHRNGTSFLDSPIERRREELFQLLGDPAEPLRLSPLLNAPASKVLAAVRELGLEGVVGKRNGSVYEAGERSGAWIKQRANLEQEFVIGGYTPGTRGFESLIVGVYEKKKLLYVARVKNGFVPSLRDEIYPTLKKLRIETCPFSNLPETGRSRWGQSLTAEKMKECAWVKPSLVCQIAFLEWTGKGGLRHSSFVAMRDDKPAKEVVRET